MPFRKSLLMHATCYMLHAIYMLLSSPAEEELAQLEAGLTHAEMIMNRVLTTSSPRTER